MNLTKLAISLASVTMAVTVHADVTITFTESGGTTISSGTDPYSSLGVLSDTLPQGTIGGASLPGGSSGVGGTTLDMGALLTPGSTGFGDGPSSPSGSTTYPQLGWLVIYAYGTPTADYGTTTGLLDLIHWDNSHQASGNLYQSMFWYSQEGTGQAADHMPSSAIITQVLKYTYTTFVTEDASGLASYTPGGVYNGGYSTNGVIGQTLQSTLTQYTYDFQSIVAPVPEPGTILAGALLVLPFGAGMVRSLRKNRLS